MRLFSGEWFRIATLEPIHLLDLFDPYLSSGRISQSILRLYKERLFYLPLKWSIPDKLFSQVIRYWQSSRVSQSFAFFFFLEIIDLLNLTLMEHQQVNQVHRESYLLDGNIPAYVSDDSHQSIYSADDQSRWWVYEWDFLLQSFLQQ